MHEELIDWQPTDIEHVTIQEPWELDFWMSHFQVNGNRLRRAIASVGSRRSDVLANLRGSGRPIG